jgi:hypothetical protein
MAGMAVAGVALAVLAGCENRESADQREQRMTQRMDRLQVDMDTQMNTLKYQVANQPTNTVVQHVPAPAPVAPPMYPTYPEGTRSTTSPKPRATLSWRRARARAARTRLRSPPSTSACRG